MVPKEFMDSKLNPVVDKKTGEKEYAQGYVIPGTKDQVTNSGRYICY